MVETEESKSERKETWKHNNAGLEYGQQAGCGPDSEVRRVLEKRKYLKEATVIINVEITNDAKAVDVIKAEAEQIGEGKILAVRPRQGKEYELILEKEEMCNDLIDGLTIGGATCEVKKLQNRDYVVSFMHLPVYLDDEGILEKLNGWRVLPVSKIKRRLYPGTNIEDGTRFIKARFPREVVSLPYSTKLDTAEGPQYFRVMHSHQVKTCRLCMSPEHLMKDCFCPDFKCYKCEERGHFARDYTAVKCPECREILNRCECWMEEEEGGGESQVDGQMHEKNNEHPETKEEEKETEQSQQGEMEKETDNEEDRESRPKNNEEQTQGQSLTWTPMELTSSFKDFVEGEFKCYQCDEQGHFARDCDAVKCPECRKVMVRCECWIVDLDGTQNTDLEDVGGQMVEETELGNAGETAKENEGNKKTNEKNQEIEEDGQEAAMDEGIWTPLNISQGALEEMEEQYAKGNEEEKKERTEGKKEGEKMDFRMDRRETIRRRITKVIPNIEVAKKKRLEKKKNRVKKKLYGKIDFKH
ncbi:Cellular nucleic acid-binding protein [Labeo rohita]|uniref:Cellular nucleic acid-binding protein n=1 Tax=Labeo rohita TaxID=84645 RepID=A0ABQ8L6R5_LABRO|nr:Cellular nucleic acid-binding protein [Labeo rohita]